MPQARHASDLTTMRFGIEAEFALVDTDGRLCDFTTLTWSAAQRIVQHLGRAGHPELTCGDLGIKAGRWYVEGDERFDAAGRFVCCVPKGLETRTPPRVGIADTVAQHEQQTAALASAAASFGYRLTSIGWNPFVDGYRPYPPYNRWELALRARRPEFTASDVYMASYGPDLNLSHQRWSDEDAVDVARLLTALSPALAPFAFSAPFRCGEVGPHLSRRTARRTGRRPAVRVFVDPAAVPPRQRRPPLIHPARIPSERGRIEFKAFDAFTEPDLYPALLALLAGVGLARPDWPRAAVPDAAAHAAAAVRAFEDEGLRATAIAALRCADGVLADAGLAHLLAPLWRAVRQRRTPAHRLLDAYTHMGVVPLPAVVPV